MSTASTTGARDHARAQADSATNVAPDVPDGIVPTWTDVVPADGYATAVLGRGTRLRLADVAGSACAHVLLLRADAPWERLNVADTVKVPWQAYLGIGHPLLSDQGRVLATIVADTSGQHDALCGSTPAGRELLARGGAKHGLTIRDIGPTVSFFRGVRVSSTGDLEVTGSAPAGSTVDLLIHLPVTVLIASSVHPLGPRSTTRLDVVAWQAPNELRTLPNTEPEYRRAVENTETAWQTAQNGVPA